MNGSASRPSSATMKGTRWAIRPATKATSRERRSSLATTTLHFASLCGGQGGRQLRAPVQGVGPLPGFGFDEFGGYVEGFRSSKAVDCGPLGLDAQAGAMLALRRNPKICNRLLHVQRAYHRMRSGRSANKSNIVAVFMLQQRRQIPHFVVAPRHERRRPTSDEFADARHVAGRRIERNVGQLWPSY